MMDIEYLLTATRSARKTLDLDASVDPADVRECLRIGLQAANGSNQQAWRWLVVSDPALRTEIAELYRMLELFQPTPVTRVNRAVAVAEAYGAGAGLSLLDGIDEAEVAHWHLYWSARAELLRRVGRLPVALDAFDRALSCSPNDSDRRFLERRRAELSR